MLKGEYLESYTQFPNTIPTDKLGHDSLQSRFLGIIQALLNKASHTAAQPGISLLQVRTHPGFDITSLRERVAHRTLARVERREANAKGHVVWVGLDNGVAVAGLWHWRLNE